MNNSGKTSQPMKVIIQITVEVGGIVGFVTMMNGEGCKHFQGTQECESSSFKLISYFLSLSLKNHAHLSCIFMPFWWLNAIFRYIWLFFSFLTRGLTHLCRTARPLPLYIFEGFEVEHNIYNILTATMLMLIDFTPCTIYNIMMA